MPDLPEPGSNPALWSGDERTWPRRYRKASAADLAKAHPLLARAARASRVGGQVVEYVDPRKEEK